jgi:hypothetical protein
MSKNPEMRIFNENSFTMENNNDKMVIKDINNDYDELASCSIAQ